MDNNIKALYALVFITMIIAILSFIFLFLHAHDVFNGKHDGLNREEIIIFANEVNEGMRMFEK